MDQQQTQKDRRAARRERRERTKVLKRAHRTLERATEEGIREFREAIEARIARLPQEDRRMAQENLRKAIRGKKGASLKAGLLATEALLRKRHPESFGPTEEEHARMIESARRLEEARAKAKEKIRIETERDEARLSAEREATARDRERFEAAKRRLTEGEEEAAEHHLAPPVAGASEAELAATRDALGSRLESAERRTRKEKINEQSREKRRGDIVRKVIVALAERRGVTLPFAPEDIRVSYVIPEGGARKKPLVFSNSRDLFEYLRAHPEFRTKNNASRKKIRVEVGTQATRLFEEGQPLAGLKQEFDDAIAELQMRPYEAIGEEIAEEEARRESVIAAPSVPSAPGEVAPAGTPFERLIRMVPQSLQEAALSLLREQMQQAAHGGRLPETAFDVLPEEYRAPVRALAEEAASSIKPGPALTEADRAFAETHGETPQAANQTLAGGPATSEGVELPGSLDSALPALKRKRQELIAERERVVDELHEIKILLMNPGGAVDLDKKQKELETSKSDLMRQINALTAKIRTLLETMGLPPETSGWEKPSEPQLIPVEEATKASVAESTGEQAPEHFETEVRERVQRLDARQRELLTDAARLTGIVRASETVGTKEALEAALQEIEVFFKTTVPFFSEATSILKRVEVFKEKNPQFFEMVSKKLDAATAEMREIALNMNEAKNRINQTIDALHEPAPTTAEAQPAAAEVAHEVAVGEVPIAHEAGGTTAEVAPTAETSVTAEEAPVPRPWWGRLLRFVRREKPTTERRVSHAAAPEVPAETAPTVPEAPATVEVAAEATPATTEPQPAAESEHTPEARLASARQEYVKADAALRASRARYGFGIGSSARFESVIASARKSWAVLKKRPGGELEITPDTLEEDMRDDIGSGAIQELDRIRADYGMDAYREFLASLITLSEKKADYDRAKLEAAEGEYKKEAEGGAAPETETERRAEVFTKFVLRERELLSQAEAESLPPKKKNAFQKLMRRLAEEWVSLPGWRRRAWSNALMVTIGGATGYIPGLPEAVYAFGIRLGIGTLAAGAAQATGRATEAIFAFLRQREQSPEDLKRVLEKLAQGIAASGVLPSEELAALEEHTAALYKEQEKRRKIRLATKAGIMIGTAVASGRLGSEAVSSWLGISPTTGAARPLEGVTTPPPRPSIAPLMPSPTPEAPATMPMPSPAPSAPIPAPHEVVPPPSGGAAPETTAALAEKLEQASVVGKGQGIWHAVRKQLAVQMEADHEKFASAHGASVEDLEQPLKLKRLLDRATMEILRKEGFIKPDGEVWIAKPGTHVTLGEGDTVTIEGGESATMWHPRVTAQPEAFSPIDIEPSFPPIDVTPEGAPIEPAPAPEPHFEPVPVPPPPEIHHATHLTGDGFETVTRLGIPREAAHDWALTTTVYDYLHHHPSGVKAGPMFKLDAAIEHLKLGEQDTRAMTMADLFEHHGKALKTALKAVEHQPVGPFTFKDAISFVKRLGFKSLEGQDHLSHVSVKSFVARVPADESLWPDLLKRGGSLFTTEEFPHPPKVTMAHLRLGRALQVLKIGTEASDRDMSMSALLGSQNRVSRILEVYDRIKK